jgi:hypothetical protein
MRTDAPLGLRGGCVLRAKTISLALVCACACPLWVHHGSVLVCWCVRHRLGPFRSGLIGFVGLFLTLSCLLSDGSVDLCIVCV